MYEVRVKYIMMKRPVTIHVEDLFSKVEEKMRQYKIRHLPVVDDKGAICGIISERDLYRICSPRITEDGIYYDPATLNNFVLRYVMTRDPLTLNEDEPLYEAIRIMAQTKIVFLPIVDKDKKVVGVISAQDVMRAVLDRMPNKTDAPKPDSSRLQEGPPGPDSGRSQY